MFIQWYTFKTKKSNDVILGLIVYQLVQFWTKRINEHKALSFVILHEDRLAYG